MRISLTAIRDEACRLFAERGYESTSMQDIADALGIRASSLYNHVQSKQELLDHICHEFVLGLTEALRVGLTISDDPGETVARGVEEQVRFKLRNSDAYIVSSRETLNVSDAVRKTMLDLRSRHRQLWREVIDSGVAQGVMSTPSEDIAALMLQEMCSYLQVIHFTREQPTAESQLVYWYGQIARRTLSL